MASNFLKDLFVYSNKADTKNYRKGVNPFQRLKSHSTLETERALKKANAPKAPDPANQYYADAMKRMSEISTQGETQADKESYQNALSRSLQASQQNQSAIQANMRKRGQVGSGLEYLGTQMANQAGAQQANEMATDRASQLQANRTSALQSLSGMAGSQMDRANAIDMFNKQQAQAALDAKKARDMAILQSLLGTAGQVGAAYLGKS